MLVKLLKLNFMALTLGKQLAMRAGRVPVRGLSGLLPAMSYSCRCQALEGCGLNGGLRAQCRAKQTE